MDKLFGRGVGFLARKRITKRTKAKESTTTTTTDNNNNNHSDSNSNGKRLQDLDSSLKLAAAASVNTTRDELHDHGDHNHNHSHLSQEAVPPVATSPPPPANGISLLGQTEKASQPPPPPPPPQDDKQQQQQQQQQQVGTFYDCLTPMTRSRLNTLAQIGEDWLYLALLGIIMAILSLSMDSVITMFLGTRIWLSNEMSDQNLLLQYLAWCITPILLVTFSTGFVHLCSPTAIGSGIPEMKTILRGVILNEYLTFRTLIAKIVGLTFTLGSGLPLGKEGPSVHMASIVATLLSKLVASFQGIYENESRTSEMLSAACAVGVAATFYAPIGGVLFSIEVTTVYFAVRNYWRGFFAACCGATIWRLLGFYVKNDESISAIFKTNFSTDYPFDPLELLVFSFIGATCGLAGAAYIKFHREIVQFFRRHKRLSDFFQQNRFVYPTLVTLIITTSTFPPLLGQYTAATLSTHTTIEHLFSNRTWSLGSQDLVSRRILDSWTTPETGFHLHLVLYILMLFWTSALASTIPTPSGVFIPVLKMGAAYGRLVGELIAAAYPLGLKFSHPASIVPGSYAVVGAAAFSGAVTHTVSTSVILFEMTGQIVHIIPVILGVLIANAVCQSLQPSIYDSIIEIKKLPYLPPIASSNSISHKILVKDFMNCVSIPFVWKERCSYAQLKQLLSTHRKIISFPLVESPATMKLLGSVARPDLLKLLYLHLGRERRLQEVCRRNSDTLSPQLQLLSTISGQLSTGGGEPVLASVTAEPNNNNNELPRKKASVDSCESDRGLEFAARRSLQPPVEPARSRAKSGNGENTAQQQQQQTSDNENDSTRILDAAHHQRCHKYGATTSTAATTQSSPSCQLHAISSLASLEPPPVILRDIRPTPNGTNTRELLEIVATATTGDASRRDAPNQLLTGEELLLNECQKRESAYEEELRQFGGVAKIVNRYDRGSSMDQELLERSIQEVEHQLASAVGRASADGQRLPPEIVVVVAAVAPAAAAAGPSEDNEPTEALHGRARRSPASSAAQHIEPRPSPPPPSPLAVRQQPTPATTNSLAASPALPTRPRKSILKTSSFGNMPKRLASSPSFSHHHLHGHHHHHLHLHRALNKNNNNNTSSSHLLHNSTNLSLENYAAGEPGGGKLNTPLGGIKFTLDSRQQQQQLTGGPDPPEQQQQQQQVVRQRRKVRLPRLRVVDMTPEEQEQWEREQLNAFIDLARCQVDEAPFQLVEQTSLYRVHTLFSMLGLNHAYVTSFGRLVGIVALKDIRYAIEKMLQAESL